MVFFFYISFLFFLSFFLSFRVFGFEKVWVEIFSSVCFRVCSLGFLSMAEFPLDHDSIACMCGSGRFLLFKTTSLRIIKYVYSKCRSITIPNLKIFSVFFFYYHYTTAAVGICEINYAKHFFYRVFSCNIDRNDLNISFEI